MEQISRSDELVDEEESYGFRELYEALDVETRNEMIQAEIAVYQRADSILDILERPDIEEDLSKMEQTGEAVASEYVRFIEKMTENEDLSENFDDKSVSEKFKEVDSNPKVLRYLN